MALQSAAKAKQSERLAERRLFDSLLAQARAGRLTRQTGRRFDSLKALSEAARLVTSLALDPKHVLDLRNEPIACMALPDLRVRAEWDGLVPGGHQSAMFDLEMRHYARADSQGNASVRRVADDTEVALLAGPGYSGSGMFSPNGAYLAVAYSSPLHNQRKNLVWNWREGTFFEPPIPVSSSGFSPDSRILAVGHRGMHEVLLYELSERRETSRIATDAEPGALAIHPDGTNLAIVGRNVRDVELRDMESGKLIRKLSHSIAAYDLAWHSDGALLAAASGHDIYLWDTTTGRQRAVLQGHQGTVARVSFLQDLLASNSWDGTFRLWDIWSGRQLLSATANIGLPRDVSRDYRDVFSRYGGANLRLCSAGSQRTSRRITIEGQMLDFVVTNNNNSLFSAQPAISPTGTLTFTPAANATGSATMSVRIHDNGGTANGGIDTFPARANLALTCTITINAPPDAMDDVVQAFPEGSSPRDINVLANDTIAPDAGETLTVTSVTQGMKGFVSIITVNGQMMVRYTLNDSDVNGPDQFTYTISDGHGGSDTATVFLLILPVNDPPSFTLGACPIVQKNAGAQSFANIATALSRGPSNESGQTLNFLVTNSNNGLFSAQPAISSTGTLTFAPASNATGSATMSVRIHDSGGTANGGIDTSPAQTCTITVNAPPVAGDDFVIRNPNQAVSSNVLSNDSDSDGDAIFVTLAAPASYGSVGLAPNGSFTYTPYPPPYPQNVDDVFHYIVFDGRGAADAAVVTIHVNQAPSATNPGTVCARLQHPTQFPSGTTSIDLKQFVNDDETPNEQLTYGSFTDPGSTFGSLVKMNGSVVVSADKRVEFKTTPTSTLGTTSFKFRATDARGRTSGLITVQVEVKTSFPAPPPPPPPDDEVPGTTTNGYVAESRVYFDANRNGVADFLHANHNGVQDAGEPDEPTALTLANGRFNLAVPVAFDLNGNGQLDDAEGRLVATGGMITSIERPLLTTLMAPAGSTTITPLTTLVVVLAERTGISSVAAMARVREALALPADDLANFDHIAETMTGNSDGPAIAAANVKLTNVVAQIASLLVDVAGGGSTASLPALGRVVTEVIADRLATAQTTMQLTNSVVIQDIIVETARRFGVALNDAVIPAAATIIAGGGARIGEIAPTADLAFLTALYRVEYWAQGDAMTDMRRASIGEVTPDAMIDAHTGAGLEAQLAAAQLGNIVPPHVTIDDVTRLEGASGVTDYVFTVRLSAPSAVPVTVPFATGDGTARTSRGDYEAASGVLRFAVGELEQTLTIQVAGNTRLEEFRRFFVNLGVASGAVVADNQGVGTIANDDTFGGNVLATRRGRTLVLAGDAGNNSILIEQFAARSFRVSVFAGTTINGQTGPMDFAGIDNVVIATGDGDDSVAIGSSTRPTNVRGSLAVQTGSGDDSVRLESTKVRGRTRINSGDGDDFVAMLDSLLERGLILNSGPGEDMMELHNSRFRGTTLTDANNKFDLLTLDHVNFDFFRFGR